MNEIVLVECWRPVVGFERRYEVSNLGAVRRTNYRKTGFSKRMKCSVSSDGYPRVTLHAPRRAWDTCVHVLVAEAFVGKKPFGFVVNHKNGIKTDNQPWNLEWCTPAQNMIHAIETGLLCNIGVRNFNAKLDDEQVAMIWQRLRDGSGLTDLARLTGVTTSQIYNIREKKSWRWLTDTLKAG